VDAVAGLNTRATSDHDIEIVGAHESR